MRPLQLLLKQAKSSTFFTEPKYEKYRLLFVPIVVLIIAILISVLVTVPQLYKLFNTFKTINELKEKKAFYQTKVSDLQAVKVSEVRSDLDTSLIALPVEKDIPGVMGELLVSLGGSGMKLNGITFSNSPQASEKAEEFSISIEAGGNETTLKNFLERVSLSPRLIKLTSIQVSTSLKGDLNASIGFATFYQTLPSNIGKVDDALPKISKEDTQILADIETKVRQFPKAAPAEAGGGSRSPVGKSDPFR